MRKRILILLVILTSLFGYLEWGTDSNTFLYEAEFDVLKNLFKDPMLIAHPFVVIPLVGQILLLVSLFRKSINMKLVYIGIACTAFLLIFIFIIGIFSMNFKIFISTIPFVIVSLLTVKLKS